ncbi:ferroxidase HEPHL1 isoform X1 [Microcaecilia unicolor]|uniref:Hephaestin n=1 Tax=Microcaecilia unicolor TaxID=1415580 RepID=A0A6P7XZ63_9AMPH|nr:hephaestin-like protein 1 isoform X1 [Microcaecilia unicolor]
MLPRATGCASALLLSALLFQAAEAATRIYYLGIVEEEWDYAPSGKNLVTGQNLTEDEQATVFLTREGNKIGRVYKKAIYRQFTDEAYTTEVHKPSWLGFLGPLLKAEVEDELVIHMKNFASRPYSLHPHGVFYEKDSEGALYPDGTSGRDKLDDFVLPGGTHTYQWIVKKQYAPTVDDPNCLTWIYHSHIDAPRDISSGLIGALLTCKKGTLAESTLDRTDVNKEFSLMFSVVDENVSWYLDENIDTYCLEPGSVDKGDADFQESNKMHAINGYVFGNLPGLELCMGDSVSWHLFGMGNEVDVHSAYFHGHTIINRGHRTDIINLFPATFVTAEMIVENSGKWMLSCQVNDHIQAGMQGLYEVKSCNSQVSAPPLAGRERKYFIAAEMVLWDYGPQGSDKFSGQALNATGSDSETFFGQGNDRIGGRYWKVHFTEFTDQTFTERKQRTEAEAHMGILGPAIKAEVGDTVLVIFNNKADRNYSILPHGVSYSKLFEGAQYADEVQKMGAHVKPGEIFTYTWTVPESVGPTASDPSCLTYLYYSSVDPVMDTNSGLVGPLLVCKKNTLNDDETQKGVDKEFYLLFTVCDENLSWYLEKNIQMITEDPLKIDTEDEHFQESNKMHAVNGFMYGNLPGLEMCQNDRVSWHMIGLGTEVDLHGIYFQGNTIQLGGMTRDTLNLFPHSSSTVSMQPDEVGSFELVCRTTDHFIGGMKQMYTVNNCCNTSTSSQKYSTVRTYYIAAEEVEWDYSPDRRWELEKYNTTEEDSPGNIFVSRSEDRIGSKYKKVIYREYVNGDFEEAKARALEEEHLEILGPIIRAEVGDIILVAFKNKANRPYSIYAHGVQEENAGNKKKVQATNPGEVNLYRWNVPERSGPGSDDPNCISWVYYSTVDFVKDMYSGLVGPLITCRRGILNSTGSRNDVAREFALLFLVFDESKSWYLNENIANYLHKDPEDFEETEEFTESNLLHAINGKLYGNLHGLRMTEGEKTNWYLLGLGNEIDMHTVHFHAQSFLFKTQKEHRADVYDLFPGTFQTVELIAGNPGTWLLHCHVADHIHAGMETTFTVHSKPAPLPPLASSEQPNTRNDGNQKIELLGRNLDTKEVNIALLSLFTIGVLLLVTVLLLFMALVFLRRKMSYKSVQSPLYMEDNL